MAGEGTVGYLRSRALHVRPIQTRQQE
jgi:hypothetical protein